MNGWKSALRAYKDPWFWSAIIVAPVVWFSLHTTGFTVMQSIDARTFIFIGFIYPILEEFVFRSGFQSWLLQRAYFRKSCRGISLANVVVSIVFALMHWRVHVSVSGLFVFFPSLVFGFFRDRYKGVYISIFLHCFYNIGLMQWPYW